MLAQALLYQTVFFDVGGTLLKARPSIGAVYAEVAARYGIEAEAGEIERAARRAFPRLRARELAEGGRHTTSTPMAKAWWRELVRESFGPAAESPRFEAFFQAVFEEFAKPERYELFPDVLPVLAGLERAGSRLGVISNWDLRLRAILQGLGIDRRFAAIVISGEVGLEKPDPRIYTLARERSGASPGDRLLHVGDNPAEDVEAARAGGFDARPLDRGGGQTLLTVLGDLIR